MEKSSVDNVCCVFLKITTFLWVILIIYPGYTSLFLETVTIKIGGPRDRGPTYGPEGRKKQIPDQLEIFRQTQNIKVYFVMLMLHQIIES